MNETNTGLRSVFAIVLSLCLALGIALLAGTLFADRLEGAEDARLSTAIDTAAEGNTGYEDITPVGSAGTGIYLVKSGTGGEDSYAVLSTAKSRGCQVESLTVFSLDGVISSVQLLSVKGGSYDARERVEASGILALFGGVDINSESLSLKGVEGSGGCDEALVKSVNRAIETIKELIADKEVSQ